jgi:hypothetical protein
MKRNIFFSFGIAVILILVGVALWRGNISPIAQSRQVPLPSSVSVSGVAPGQANASSKGAGASLDHWYVRSSLMPTGEDLLALTYGNHTFVAVGTNGTIVTSPDDITWTICSSGCSDTINAVVYGNGTFVAVGGKGTILTSPDGKIWTRRSPNADSYFTGVCYGNGTFVAVADFDIQTSSDGIIWTDRGSGKTQFDIRGVAYGGHAFVAVGEHNGVGEELTSTDGINWVFHALGQNLELSAVTYGNGIFVATGWMGTIATSPDGTTWSIVQSDIRDDLTGVAWGNNIFVAVASVPPMGNQQGTIITSPDGKVWTTRWDSSIGYPPTAVAYCGKTFVAVGKAGSIFSSMNGTTWINRGSGYRSGFTSITFGDHTFVAVGDDAIMTSPDGLNWISRVAPRYNLQGVAYGSKNFVAVGNEGAILTSDDGVTWTDHSLGYGPPLFGVAWGNGMFVAVGGNGHIITSPDGSTWTLRYYEYEDVLNSVAYTGKTFVAVGSLPTGGSLILTSPNGLTWAPCNQGAVTGNINVTNVDHNAEPFASIGYGSFPLYSVAYGNNTFMAVGRDGIMTSNDGIVWQQQDLDMNTHLDGIVFADNTFVAVGNKGIIYTSPDGTYWTRQSPCTQNDLTGITYGNNTFVAATTNKTIIQSGIVR